MNYGTRSPFIPDFIRDGCDDCGIHRHCLDDGDLGKACDTNAREFVAAASATPSVAEALCALPKGGVKFL